MNRKRIVKSAAASLLAVSLLTGCGSGSLVDKGREEAAVSYNDGSEPLKLDKTASSGGQRSVSKSQQQWICKYLEVEKECLKQGVVRHEEEVDNSLEAVAGGGLKPEEIQNEDQYVEDVYADGKDKMAQFAKALEQAGFYGIEKIQQFGLQVQSHGLLFVAYDTEDDEGKTVYDISVTVMGSSVVPAEKYSALVGEEGSSAFSLIDQIQGGFYEYYSAAGDYSNGETDYYNGIQMYVSREDNRVEALSIWGNATKSDPGKDAFSKEQKAVLKQLIANYTGDAKAAEEFVEKFQLDGDSHGTIGNKKWRLGKGKNYNEMPAYKINFS